MAPGHSLEILVLSHCLVRNYLRKTGPEHKVTIMAKILLVDDDTELTSLLTDILEMEGFDIIEANNGEQGLSKVDDSIDLILLDVMMPNKDGLEVLRSLEQARQIPVLMLTAKGDDLDSVIGLELGADDYLAKPCNPRVLVAHIRAVLRRSKKNELSHKETLQIQDVVLNSAKRSVTCFDKPIDMTSTEFQVLEVLMQNAGHIVEKSELHQKALGKPLGKYDRSLDMHVSNLRRKLGKSPGGDERIKTVRGVGYQYSY